MDRRLKVSDYPSCELFSPGTYLTWTGRDEAGALDSRGSGRAGGVVTLLLEYL